MGLLWRLVYEEHAAFGNPFEIRPILTLCGVRQWLPKQADVEIPVCSIRRC
jgi:hypothetical protein